MSYKNYNKKTLSLPFEALVGKTLKSVENKDGDEIIFTAEDGRVYRQIYYNDCCAICSVEEIHGDLNDLVGSRILMAEEVSSTKPNETLVAERKAAYEEAKKKAGNPKNFYTSGPNPQNDWADESETWTFYKVATNKGSVTIRWYGSSNGYYSESPTFEEVLP